MKNPFSLSFGKKPGRYISRITQTNEIIEDFTSDEPSNRVYMITGVRGSGKTVMLTDISHALAQNDDFICIELNPTRDMLQSLAAKLYGNPEMHPLFIKAKFDFSALGLGVSIEKAPPVTDIENAIALMLETVKKSGKKVLITIDEVTNNENVKVFTTAFQIMIRDDAPICLIMTGLYENLYDLQNDKSLTFLYRAPKIVLEPLNYTAVRKNYMDIFNATMEEAERMATLTKGYPFAFQVLGYLCWEEKNHCVDNILTEYDHYLADYVYSKIWSETSEEDKKLLYAMSLLETTSVKEIREAAGMKMEKFSVYRERLIRKGIVVSGGYGNISFSLPRFSNFVKDKRIENAY